MSLRRLAGAALLASVLLPSAAATAAPSQHPDNRWLRYALDAAAEPDLAALALDPERERELREQGHGFVELLMRVQIRVERDGLLTQRILRVRHYLTENGVQEAGNLHFRAAADRVTAVIEAAHSLAPGGERHDVDLATVQVETSDRRVFSDARDVIVPFAGLRPGASAVLAVALRESLHAWPLPWSQVHTLQSSMPIERYEVDVEWAPGAPRLAVTENDPSFECREQGPNRRRCVRLRAPAIASDPDVLSYYDVIPHLVISAAHDWAEIAGRELPLVQRALARSPALERTALRIAGQAATPLAKLIALQRFVADEIRYVGLEHGASAVAPHPASLTLERRYGDCKDKVALFLALAQYVGLDAHATLVGTEHFAPEHIPAPAPAYFDHMIACVNGIERDGGGRCVDLTDPYTESGRLSTTLGGAVALDVVAGASLRQLEPEPFMSYTELRSTNQLGCDGAIEETVEHRLGAYAATATRANLRGLPQPERKRWAREWHSQVMGDRFTPEVELRGVDDGSDVVAITSRVRYTDAVEWKGRETYREEDAWLKRYLATMESENQTHAYLQPGFRMHSELAYELCKEHAVAFPGPELAFRHEFGSLVRRYERTEGGIRVISDLEIPRRTLPVAELPRFKRFLELLGESSVISFDFEPRR